jgi:hypothetical protein
MSGIGYLVYFPSEWRHCPRSERNAFPVVMYPQSVNLDIWNYYLHRCVKVVCECLSVKQDSARGFNERLRFEKASARAVCGSDSTISAPEIFKHINSSTPGSSASSPWKAAVPFTQTNRYIGENLSPTVSNSLLYLSRRQSDMNKIQLYR